MVKWWVWKVFGWEICCEVRTALLFGAECAWLSPQPDIDEDGVGFVKLKFYVGPITLSFAKWWGVEG